MTNFEELKIVRIGTLHYIPVNKSTRFMDLSSIGIGVDDGDEPAYGQLRIVATSGQDQFHNESGDRHWVAIDIPALHNGETRSVDDIIRDLGPIYAQLFQEGLVPNMEFPGMIIASPFDLVPQMA